MFSMEYRALVWNVFGSLTKSHNFIQTTFFWTSFFLPKYINTSIIMQRVPISVILGKGKLMLTQGCD